MVSVHRYTFAFRQMSGVTLDDQGHEVETRLVDYDYDYEPNEDLPPGEPLSLKKKKRPRVLDRLNEIVDPDHLAKKRKRVLNEMIAHDGHRSKARSPSEHLHELALAEQRQFPDMKYTDAVHRVIDQNPKIVRMYASESNGKVRVHVVSDSAGDYGDPSEHVTRMAKAMLDWGDAKNFKEAVTKVLIERPKLAARYAEWTSNPANAVKEPPKVNMMTEIAAKQIVKAHHERIKREGLCTYG